MGEFQGDCGGLKGTEYSGPTNSKLAHLKLTFRAKPCTVEKLLGTESKLSIKETREEKEECGPDKQLGGVRARSVTVRASLCSPHQKIQKRELEP